MNERILILEDDVDLGQLLKQYLEINNFIVNRVNNGEEAREELKKNEYNLLIVDVMMPKEDGFTFAEKLSRTMSGIPFLFLTARKLKEDVLHGLKLGADDYIIKPFDADELVLRIRNILKRSKHLPEQIEGPVEIGNYKFDSKNLTLCIEKITKSLTEKEAQLLYYFYQHQNQLIKRKDILDKFWPVSDFFYGRSMDVFITRLRKHLAKDPAVRIESIRGVGFRFFISGN